MQNTSRNALQNNKLGSIWLPILTVVLSLSAIFSTVLPTQKQQSIAFWGMPWALCLWLLAAVAITILAALFALPILLGASDD